MTAVCLVDTSIFVNILRVPQMSDRHGQIVDELTPMATVLETGNHIGQRGDGNQRRQCAARFVDQVQKALNAESPFTPISFPEREFMQQWLDQFPDRAMQGSGLGDLSIMHDWERLCAQNPGRRVYIWSLDEHLSSFDREGHL